MKKFRFSLVLVVLALILATVSAAFAQDDTLGASPADFGLWTSANETTGQFETVAFNFTVTLDASGMGESNTTANLTGTGVVSSDQADPKLQLDVTGSVVQGETTQPVNLNVRIVDGMAYANDGTGWKGTTLDKVMSEVGSQVGGLTGDSSGDLSSLGSMSGMGDAMTALEGLKPSDFLTLTRTDEGGQAHFSLAVNVANLLSSPALSSVFGMMGGMMGGGSDAPAMTDAQLQQMQAMIAGMFSTATITFDEYVDPSSQLIQRAVVDISLPLDMMVGPGAVVKFNFDLSLSDFNAPVSVEAPADAVIQTDSQ